MPEKNKYAIDEQKKLALGSAIREIKPARKPTLTAIINDIRADIETARKNGASWDEIANSFNHQLGLKDDDSVSGNTLSQIYITVRKRVEASRKGIKPSYEMLEKRVQELERENDKLKKEVEKRQKK